MKKLWHISSAGRLLKVSAKSCSTVAAALFGGEKMWLTDIANKHPISHNFSKGGIRKPIHGLVLHIQEGTEAGTRSWFNNPAAKASAHFGNPKVGRMEQFVDTNDMAWAQRAGNHNWISIENEGKHGDALTSSQILNVSMLMNWLHDNEDVPLELAQNPAAFGLGYHSMGGKAWGHIYCPGDTIIRQRPLILAIALLTRMPGISI